MFLIYIDDLKNTELNSEGTEIVLYADDILLYRPISSENDFVALQSDVDHIETWATSNFMSFNLSKCKVMHVSRKS